MSQDSELTTKIKSLLKQGKTVSEVIELTNAGRSTVYQVRKGMKKETGEAEVKPSQVTVEHIEPEKTEELQAEELAEGEKLQEPLTKISGALMTGVFTTDDTTALIEAVNGLFPAKHQRTDKQIALVGKVWNRPLNRILEKYLDENVDLYLAVVVTVLVFAPSLYGVVKDYQKEHQKGKEEKPIGEAIRETH